jgi:hypothetical protein
VQRFQVRLCADRDEYRFSDAARQDDPRLKIDDPEGWGRPNLFAAADGYGAFHGNVIVDMDASKAGLFAFDRWRNDFGGDGKLTKRGTGGRCSSPVQTATPAVPSSRLERSRGALRPRSVAGMCTWEVGPS